MAKVVGALKIRGAIDDLTFRQTEDGNIVQPKTGPTKEQVLTHKSFRNTRLNAREFGRVVKDATLLRRAMGDMINAVIHSKLNSHTNKLLHQMRKSDTVNPLGYRHANAGNINLLEGFDFSHLLGLDTALPVALACSMDVHSGSMQVTVPDTIVRRKKAFPAGASHFRIMSCAAMVDFDKEQYASHIVQSDLMPLSKKMPAIVLENQLAVLPGEVLLHTVGIVFYQVDGDAVKMLRGGALKIVGVARKEPATVEPVPSETGECLSEVSDDAFSLGMKDGLGNDLQGEAPPSTGRGIRKLIRISQHKGDRLGKCFPASMKFPGEQQE
jgi:hypothetical protein